MTELRRMRPLLGTDVALGVQGNDEAALARAAEAAFASLADAQQRWSFQAADSELTRLNQSQGERVPLSPATLRLLRLARALMQRSGGLFNCTVGGALVQAGALPDHGGDRAMLAQGTAEDLLLGHGWARLQRPVRLTLDGLAKGFAVDRAVAALRRHGAMAGWVNAGGDLRVFGELSLPVSRRELDGRLTPLGALRNAALASSAVGHDDALRHPALLIGEAAPATGVWSVIARSAWRANALTKVAALAPAAERAACVTRLGGVLVMPPGAG